ncbi:PHP domain-containing protein [Candidatus Vidania fulgoroideorum]
MFCNLKFYSEYSNVGIFKIKEIINLIKLDGQNTLCITDINNISAYIKSSILSEKHNIKNILASEIYIKDKISGSLTILTKNKKGYVNICKILNESWKNFSLYKKNFINLEFLKKHYEGLLIYTGGEHSFSKGILKGSVKNTKKILRKFFLYFDKKNFLIEIQRYNKKSKIESEKLINLAYYNKIPIIATNPNIYEEKKYKVFKTKFCIKNKIKYDNFKDKSFKNYKFISNREINEIFNDIPSSIENTTLVSEKCNFKILKKNRFPKFYKKVSSFKYLKRKLIKVSKKKKLNNKYLKLLKYEIYTIKKTNFSNFFLVVSDIIKWAKKKKKFK